MDDFYNHIQYVVPENSEISFSFLPEARDVALKLLDGVANIHVKGTRTPLPLQLEFSLQLWECLCPRLKTTTGCNFLVRGNHYVSSAIQHGLVTNTLFGVSPSGNSYSFVLQKHIQLQIFPVKSTEQEFPVTISVSRGAPEISGFKLSRETTYNLSPFSPVLLKSSDEKPFSVYVQGLDRKVKLFARDENHDKCVNDVKDQIFANYFSAKQFKHIGPTVLVLGPKNAGKTSFCQLLVNETLEKKMTPLYVDLNIKRNLNVPGLLSLSEIDGRIDYSTLDFKFNIQRLLCFGSEDFHSFNLRFYYFLVRKMGGLLSSHLNYNIKPNSISIIDSNGSHWEDNKPIEILLKSFAVDLVVYIGDEHHYKNLKNSILGNVPSEFIPKPLNVEQPSESYEKRNCQHQIQKHIFGSTNPSPRIACTLALCLMNIYSISTLENDTSARGDKLSDYKIEHVSFNVSANKYLINRLFGVSAARRVEFPGMAEVKYYVYFTDIDMAAKTASVMVPESENFNGGILLLGYIPRLEDSQII